MSKELFMRVLQCNHCNSGNLNFSKAIFKSRLKPKGKISCRECESIMPFVNGVLIAGKANWSKNQKRNAYIYSDFWERSDKAIKYQRVTHEDELLDKWRKEFKEGVLMDAGCGSGRHLNHWIKNDVKSNSFVMVDISDSIFQCREYFEELNCSKPAIFIQSSINNLPIKDQMISSTWTSGVVGLLENQKSTLREICRVSNKTFHLGVLTEKTFVGKLYIAANIVKPLFNKVKNMKLLFMLSGLMARGAIWMLKLLNFLNLPLALIRKDHLNNIINDPNAISRLQHSLYDPIIIPHIIKHPDLKYIEWVKKYGFMLKSQETEIICDYFHFYKR